LIFQARVPLGHVSNVDPSVVPESHLVLDERVRLALELLSVKLNRGSLKLGVHLLAVSKEVLRVPEVSLDLRVDVHLLKKLNTFVTIRAITSILVCPLTQMFTSIKNEHHVVVVTVGVVGRVVLDDERVVGKVHIWAPVVLNLLPEHVGDLVGIDDFLALLGDFVTNRLTVLALEPDTAEVPVLITLVFRLKSAHFVCNKELALSEVIDGPGTAELLRDTLGSADIVFTRRHININDLHSEPCHEDEEGDHGKNTADGRVISTILLVGETDRLAKPVEFFEEFRVLVLRHYLK